MVINYILQFFFASQAILFHQILMNRKNRHFVFFNVPLGLRFIKIYILTLHGLRLTKSLSCEKGLLVFIGYFKGFK